MCYKKKGEVLTSPIFRAKCFDDTAWYLKFYPEGDSQSDNDYISCHLTRKNDAYLYAIECDFLIEFIGKNGCSIISSKDTQKFEKESSWGWCNFLKKGNLLKNVLYNDTLIIRCTLSKKMPEKFFYSRNSSTTKCLINNYSIQWVVKCLNSDAHRDIIKFQCSGPSCVEIAIEIPEDDVKIFLKTHKNFSRSQFVLRKITLLDAGGMSRDSRSATHLFDDTTRWEFPTFIKKSQLEAESDMYLKDGCFTLRCDISFSDGSTVEDTLDTPFSNEFAASAVDTVSLLNEDLKRMFTDKIHTDVKLKAGGEVFSAHKSILSVRSPVFLTMFNQDMAESRKGEVDIPDFDAKTVDLFLKYIYTGNVNDIDYENATKLILVADKYQVLSLKDKCGEFLASVLTEANVCEILVTADLVRLDALKASVFDFIKMQPKEIFKSEEWRNCVKNNMLLAVETASEVAMLLGD